MLLEVAGPAFSSMERKGEYRGSSGPNPVFVSVTQPLRPSGQPQYQCRGGFGEGNGEENASDCRYPEKSLQEPFRGWQKNVAMMLEYCLKTKRLGFVLFFPHQQNVNIT